MKFITKTITKITNISLTKEEILTLNKAQCILDGIWDAFMDTDSATDNVKIIMQKIDMIGNALDEIATRVDCVDETN